jgi:hypothetical protein
MKESSYLAAGFDENILRDPYMANFPEVYDSVNIGELFAAGSTPISGELIQAGAVTQDKIEGISILGWAGNFVFTALSNVNVSWNLGSITLSDGTVFTIQAGSTGTMSAVTYIYFDKSVSETALQITTTAANAVGVNKILVAVAQNVVAGKLATWKFLGGAGEGVLITADNIAANTITGNELATNNIITNTAQIANGIITSAKISDLSADKITSQIVNAQIASLDYAKITSVAVTNAQIVSLSADKINAGTIVGRDIWSSSSGGRIVLSNGDRLYFYDGAGSLQGSIYGSTDDLVIFAYDNVNFAAGGSTRAYIGGSQMVLTPTDYQIYWSAHGYILKPDADKLVVNANWCPNTHRGNTLGASNREWSDIRARWLHLSSDAWADHWYTNSDKRLKKDISELENSLEKISRLRGVSYRWIDEEKEPGVQLGLIAQEVRKIFPEVVVEVESGEEKMLTMNYMGLIPVLVEAIKELNKKVDNLSN